LLAKYGALVEAAIPAFAAKLDKEEPIASNVKPEIPTSETFQRVLREVEAWDWDDPTTTKKAFGEAFKRKVSHYSRLDVR
jgi:hypothetical protein